MKRLLAPMVLASTLAVLPACYGSYGAFNKVHDWNAEVTANKWSNSAIHLALWLIPVYELTILGDFLIFNTIEHFTGKNPFGGDAAK